MLYFLNSLWSFVELWVIITLVANWTFSNRKWVLEIVYNILIHGSSYIQVQFICHNLWIMWSYMTIFQMRIRARFIVLYNCFSFWNDNVNFHKSTWFLKTNQSTHFMSVNQIILRMVFIVNAWFVGHILAFYEYFCIIL